MFLKKKKKIKRTCSSNRNYNPHADKPIGVSGDGKYLIYLSGRRSKLKKRLNSNQVSIINKNLGGTYGKKMGS